MTGRQRLIASIAGVALAISGALLPAHAAPADHRVLMSNIRYCPERPFPCDPADVGYASGADGSPMAPVYSPITTVAVHPGDTVTFIYDEPTCALGIYCPPHGATFTDGSIDTPDTMRQGETLVIKVPLGARPGTTMPYYCKYHASIGMTGALQVV